MEEFGGYIEDILLEQLSKKYSTFKHGNNSGYGYSKNSFIVINDMKDTGNGITVYFTIPGNEKRKEKSEFYTYKTLLKCASDIDWGAEFGEW